MYIHVYVVVCADDSNVRQKVVLFGICGALLRYFVLFCRYIGLL